MNDDANRFMCSFYSKEQANNRVLLNTCNGHAIPCQTRVFFHSLSQFCLFLFFGPRVWQVVFHRLFVRLVGRLVIWSLHHPMFSVSAHVQFSSNSVCVCAFFCSLSILNTRIHKYERTEYKHMLNIPSNVTHDETYPNSNT